MVNAHSGRPGRTLLFTATTEGMRLDKFLADQGLELSRSRLHALISEGMALINNCQAKPSQKVHRGDLVSLNVPPPRTLDVEPQPIPLSVAYEDDHIIVVDKPAGLSVHPGPGHPDGTLVNALLARCPDLQGVVRTLTPWRSRSTAALWFSSLAARRTQAILSACVA